MKMAVLRSLEAVRGPGRFGHRNEHVDNMVHLLFLMTVSNVYSKNIISCIYIYPIIYIICAYIYIYIYIYTHCKSRGILWQVPDSGLWGSPESQMKRDVFNGASKQKAADCAYIYIYTYIYIYIYTYISLDSLCHVYKCVYITWRPSAYIYIYIYVYIEHTVHGRNPAQVGNYG